MTAQLGRADRMDGRTSDLITRIRRYALPEPGDGASAVVLRQRGEIRFDPGRRWLPYRAGQFLEPADLRFRWRATVTMAPLIRAKVIDAFAAGRGMLEARVFGVPVMRARGPAIDKGECMRLLAELPWCPAAFGQNGLTWLARDERTLQVTYEHSGLIATVWMDVAETGQVTAAWADDRPRQVGKRAVPTRWIGRYADYRDFGAVRAPAAFAVDWEPPEGPFTYVRGTVHALSPRSAASTG